MENRRLGGRGVVVTRPREQAAGLAQLIEAAGGTAILFPAIEIVAVPDCPGLARLGDHDIAVFVSPTAVQRALPRSPLPKLVLAVGAGTRRELERHGVDARAPADGADSEALLALPELQSVKGKRIVIVRGQGGRELLGETLAARGARVEYAECYARARPKSDPAPLLAACERGEVHAVTVSSTEGLENFLHMTEQSAALRERLPWFVPHARVAEQARQRGVGEAIVAGAGDAEMLTRLMAYFDAP